MDDTRIQFQASIIIELEAGSRGKPLIADYMKHSVKGMHFPQTIICINRTAYVATHKCHDFKRYIPSPKVCRDSRFRAGCLQASVLRIYT